MRDLYERYAGVLAEVAHLEGVVALIVRDVQPGPAAAFAAATAQVHVLDGDAADRPRRLLPLEQPKLLIDAGPPDAQLGNLRQLFLLLAAGGRYVVDEPAEDLVRELRILTAQEPPADPARAELADSITSATFGPGCVTLVKAHRHLAKLREWEVDEVLTARYGSSWGGVLEHRPARTVTSRARVFAHGDGPIDTAPKQMAVPPLRVREYRDAVVGSRQLAVLGDYVLPDTFRHPHQPVLSHRRLRSGGPYATRLAAGRYGRPRAVPGSCYALDTEHPGHFGHVTTEVLARVWGWAVAVRRDPAVRPLLTGRVRTGTRESPQIPAFERTLLEAAGVPLDRAEVLKPRELVRVERLIAATPQFENPYYVDPDLTQIWRRVASSLGVDRIGDSPARIFVTRSPTMRRACHQHDEVEEFFRRRGFAIVAPETLPFAEQARLFAGAEVVAGYGGSGLFTMLLAPLARIVIITGDGYLAENEHLIAAANGNELHYFWGVSDREPPAGGTKLPAGTLAAFSFDLARHRGALDEVIAGRAG